MSWFESLVAPAVGLFTGMLNAQGQEEANAQNVSLARDQMAFQERMSGTAHQREVADLKAAGLNPMLSVMHGGASTPSGALAHVENVAAAGTNSASKAARSTSDLQIARAQIENLQEQKYLISSQADQAAETAQNQRSQALLNAILIPKVQAETALATSSASHLQAQTRLVDQTVNKVLAETSHIKSDQERIHAATQKILAEAKVVPLTGLQIQQATVLAAQHVQESKQRQQVLSGTTQHMALGLPKAFNEAEAQGSWWMQNVSPYLPDFLKGTSSAVGLNNLFK